MTQKDEDKVLGLISERRAERFLFDVANLIPMSDGPMADVISGTEGLHEKERARAAQLALRYPEIFKIFSPDHGEVVALHIGFLLRKICNTADHWHRLRDIYGLEAYYHWEAGPNATHSGNTIGNFSIASSDYPDQQISIATVESPATAFRAVLMYLQANEYRLRHCPNAICSNPYFFKAKDQKKQIYCSQRCADIARRASKSRWWNANRGKGGLL